MPYSNYYRKSGLFHGSAMNIMGTRLDVVMMGDEPRLSEVWRQIMTETERLHRMLNRFDTASEISFINSEAAVRPVELKDELWGILFDIQQYHQLTLGYFDPSLRDFNQVILNANSRSVKFAEKNISLDLGGYAKGYALERIKEIMLQAGVAQALVNFGNSSILAVGSHPHGQYWGVGVENPFQPGQQLKTYELYNQSMSTSGNSPKHTEHIINPRLGKFSSERKFVTVVSTHAVEAEALTTALMVADNDSVASIKKACGNVVVDIWEGL